MAIRRICDQLFAFYSHKMRFGVTGKKGALVVHRRTFINFKGSDTMELVS